LDLLYTLYISSNYREIFANITEANEVLRPLKTDAKTMEFFWDQALSHEQDILMRVNKGNESDPQLVEVYTKMCEIEDEIFFKAGVEFKESKFT